MHIIRQTNEQKTDEKKKEIITEIIKKRKRYAVAKEKYAIQNAKRRCHIFVIK